jgi:Mrp family chromosome partitioning ATPase
VREKMTYPATESVSQVHEIVTNLNYALKLHSAKNVLVVSDFHSEGKTTFLASCAPLLASIYQMKVLIFDMTTEHEELATLVENPLISYVNSNDLDFLNGLGPADKIIKLNSYFNELSKQYDLVLINMNTLRRAEKTTVPAFDIDGAILVRSSASTGLAIKKKYLTEELIDREIKILGIVNNEGL